MVKQISVVATIIAEAGSEEIIYQELQRLVLLTRKEEGCINYVLHRSNDESGLFIMYENWKSEEDLNRHNQSDHLKTFKNDNKGALKEIQVYKLTMIENDK